MADSNIKVSVWLITYNHQNYIAQAIESVLMQKTNFDFEIVIGEDCSTDSTRDIIKKYEIRYPTIIKAIYQEKNVGAVINAFEYTLPRCTGEYIAFLEGDDYWIDPLKLQKQVDFMDQHKEFGLVYTDVNFYYQSLNIFRNRIFNTGYFPIYTLEQFLISGGYIAPCTWLLRKEVIPDKIDKECTDGSFQTALEIWSKHKVKYLDETTAVYRIADGSASYPDSLVQKYKREKGLFKIKMEYCDKYFISKAIKDEIHKSHIESIHQIILKYVKSDTPLDIKEWVNFINHYNFKESHLICALFNEIKGLNKSFEYKLGTTMLKPYYIFKKIMKRARRYFS